MARVTFDSVFIRLPDGSFRPRQPVRVGGITVGPGITIARGMSFGGIDIAQFESHDLEIATEEGIIIITGIY